ncbi:MAG: hypothetical protein KGP27_09485 [Hyphomicrobiales bacterium]|nr:hypothetical protein [Hyphomicrobiales bacterium]
MSRTIQAVLLILLLGLGVASAQYDRDGRYVPSPNGIPADPNARLIPLYPGTPGQAIGTPLPPRMDPVPRPPAMTPRIDTPPSNSYWRSQVRIDRARCRAGWSRATGLSRIEFRRRCSLVLRGDR